MQKCLPHLILLISFILPGSTAFPADNALQSIQKQGNEIYRIAQDMVEHGSDGHTGEIVSYGKKILERAAKLLKIIEAHPSNEMKNKEMIIDLLKEMIRKTETAVRFGEKHRQRSALASAEKVSFRAKKLRQRLLALN